MFGVMTHLNVVLCQDADDAIARGYNHDAKYKGATLVEINEAVVVRQGTAAGHATVDLLLVDEAGKTYVVQVTSRLLKALPL